jgi:hypothetical protein
MQDRDDNRFDLDIRAIIGSGQEEVPDRVWEDLVPRLDIMAEERRRRTFLRWMRYVTAAASVAAVIAIAIVFPWGADISAPVQDAIAVVEQEDEAGETEKYIALAASPEEVSSVRKTEEMAEETVPSSIPSVRTDIPVHNGGSVNENVPADDVQVTGENAEGREEAAPATSGDTETAVRHEKAGAQEEAAGIPEAESEKYTGSFAGFGPEERQADRSRISITMSGNALTNSKAKGSSTIMMKAPEMPGRNSFQELTESSYGIPLSFGIGARIEFTRRWSMSAGLNYTMLSRSFRGTYTDKDGKTIPETSIVNNQSYIGIPVNVYFNIISGDFVDFYAYAGGTMERCLENKFILKDAAPDVIRKKVSGLQWSAGVGLGAEFILTDWLGLYIDPSVRYYFKGNQPKSIRTQQPFSLGFELGFRVRL